MEAAAATDLARNYAALLVLDMPQGSEFGIDLHSWTTGPNFKGVKMIPTGPHIIYFKYVLPCRYHFFR
jgi:A1 cistron-splicing factor AAR2